MKEAISNHSAGVVGTSGIAIGKADISSFIPDQPAEWLIFLSTILVLCQLGHYMCRFLLWLSKGDKDG